MNLRDYQEWLVNEQWNGYPLDMILDATDFEDPAKLRIAALRSLFILATGYGGEPGEGTEHLKKWVRDGKLDRKKAALELGDTLAYMTWLAKVLGFSLEDIAYLNYEKLKQRGKKV